MNTTTIQIVIPKDLADLLGPAHAQAAEAVKEFAVLGLFQENRISMGKAAELLGMNQRAFISLLARKGIEYFRFDEQDLASEVNAARAWETGHA
jgi:predicted HTH domain antitoxin